MGAINRLYKTYKQDVEFFVVYIREAHAADSSWPDPSLPGVMTPRSLKERATVAKQCTTKLAIKLPLLIDSMKNEVERKYRAWPDRLFLVGKDGKIAYRGGRGPWGFKPRQLERAIKTALARQKQTTLKASKKKQQKTTEPAKRAASPKATPTQKPKPKKKVRWF